MRTPGHREEAGRNVLSEYGAWKCGKEGLSASTISVSRVIQVRGQGGVGDWKRGSPGPISDKE